MTRLNLTLTIALLLSLGASLFGQTITSSVLGTVVDPTGATVGLAEVQLTNQSTGTVNRAVTDNAGLFRIVNIFAGNYSVTIQAKGFKNLSVRDIVVDASEAHDLGRLVLALGEITDSVSVTAEVAAVQTASSERAPLLDNSQLNVDSIKGRDLMSYMKLLPGVVDTTTGRDISGGSIMGGLTFSGTGGGQGLIGFSVDGATDMDTGCSSCFAHFEPNIDAIGEVKVLMSNFAAEYGRNSGATISVTTKSGTQQFHGSGWWTHRHEDLNANQFFNNQTGQPIPRYRYNIAGWTLGGPIYIPKLFNTSKTKLFFFASQEYTRSLLNAANQYRTMPSQIERGGDFSQSFNPGNSLIVVNDPNTGQPFPGNIIPQSRINGWGQAMLNFFPMPNTYFPPGSAQYQQDNFQSEASGSHARRDDIIRGDVNLTSKLTGYFRYGHDYDFQDALYAGIQFNSAIQGHPNPGTGLVGSVNYTFSPTLVNQATYNWSYNYFSYYEEVPAQVARSLANGTTGTPQAGQPLPSLFPLHPLGPGPGGDLLEGPAACSNGYCPYLPGFSFGSTPVNAASFGESNVDYVNTNRIYQFSDNLTWIKNNHTVKAGIYIERNRKLQPGSPTYTGSYNFQKDVNNPLDSGNGFANALLGNYDTYTENSGHFVYDVYYWNREFYVQDDWRIGKRLTLNYGMRFYNLSPQEDELHEFSYFNPSLYSASQVSQIYTPYCKTGNPCSGSNRVSINPAVGPSVTYPASYIGLFVPGSGNPANGMVVDGLNGASVNTYTNRVLAPAPRIGFALDVFGNGKTALRGGWGVFYDRLDGNQVYSMSGQPPVGYQPTAYYGTISNLASAGGLIGPPGLTMWSGNTALPQNRSASLGVQQNIGWGTVLDVAYQLNQGIHRYYLRNLNAVPLGADFSTQYLDPTTAISNPLNPPHLPAAFQRPNYPGFGDINQHDFGGRSNYNGLQIAVRHRLQHGLTFGVSFAWSRFMAVTSFDPLVPNNNARNYGPNGADRRLLGAINYSYDLPGIGKRLNLKPLGYLTDGWTLSGITGFSSGAPFTPSFTTTNGLDITGSTSEGARINVVSNPYANVPQGTPGLPHGVLYFNPAAFAEPAVGTIGNAGVNIMYGPSYINWDMSLARRIPLKSEARSIQLRVEAFNAFNHVQFTGVNSSFIFNAAGVNTNSNIGALTGERGPRVVALELRAQF
ncbi:MAG TPA: carboxypeptidase-like regulatory domain-containing protein [Bryobacteraceae bacterium]|nr:carboxypeptidase-like regulatory domain-containing protein [Bryobacteraceae bacterium]